MPASLKVMKKSANHIFVEKVHEPEQVRAVYYNGSNAKEIESVTGMPTFFSQTSGYLLVPSGTQELGKDMVVVHVGDWVIYHPWPGKMNVTTLSDRYFHDEYRQLEATEMHVEDGNEETQPEFDTETYAPW